MPLHDDAADAHAPWLSPAVTAVGAATSLPQTPAVAEGEPRGRASIVLLFNGRREMLLRRLPAAPGLPHARPWTAGVAADVLPGESYATTAARALRDALDLRPGALRFVGKAFVDAPGARTFLGVFVAAHDGAIELPAGGDHAFVPVQRVLRALRRAPQEFDEAFARACRLIDADAGDDDASDGPGAW